MAFTRGPISHKWPEGREKGTEGQRDRGKDERQGTGIQLQLRYNW